LLITSLVDPKPTSIKWKKDEEPFKETEREKSSNNFGFFLVATRCLSKTLTTFLKCTFRYTRSHVFLRLDQMLSCCLLQSFCDVQSFVFWNLELRSDMVTQKVSQVFLN